MTLGQLEAIVPIWPHERPLGVTPMTDLTATWASRKWAIGKLEKALRSERLLAETEHWSSDGSRAFALNAALNEIRKHHKESK